MSGPVAKRMIDLHVRFWRKVDRSAGPEACWPFMGSRRAAGYGVISVGKKNDLAHRVAFRLAKGGVIPDGMLVCHSCDNPPCCNPAHLWLGTDGDNIADMIRKGRAVFHRGERVAHAKLTASLVAELRQQKADGTLKCRAAARRLGVCPKTIRNACDGLTWRHIAAA